MSQKILKESSLLTSQFNLFVIEIVQYLSQVLLYFNIVQRWILSRYFKDDINNDYGIYSDYGDVVMEAVDHNGEYEEQAADGEDEYDNMYQ